MAPHPWFGTHINCGLIKFNHHILNIFLLLLLGFKVTTRAVGEKANVLSHKSKVTDLDLYQHLIGHVPAVFQVLLNSYW